MTQSKGGGLMVLGCRDLGAARDDARQADFACNPINFTGRWRWRQALEGLMLVAALAAAHWDGGAWRAWRAACFCYVDFGRAVGKAPCRFVRAPYIIKCRLTSPPPPCWLGHCSFKSTSRHCRRRAKQPPSPPAQGLCPFIIYPRRQPAASAPRLHHGRLYL
jgi:hypothetical protein